MRCPVCQMILSDSPLGLESHRKNRKGACGEVPLMRRPPTTVATEEHLYAIAKVRRKEREGRNHQMDPATHRLHQAQHR